MTLKKTRADEMFTPEMVAPCGLNCALCIAALDRENPCPGCLGPDANKREFCVSGCGIIQCELRKALPDGYCDQCPDYPCGHMIERETRYANDYPMAESPMGNLACLRKDGMDALLEREKERWTCSRCQGVICVHTGECSECGARYTVRSAKALMPHGANDV